MASGDEFSYSPVLEGARLGRFGYSLPEQEYASERTIRKERESPVVSRKTFGGVEVDNGLFEKEKSQVDALESLMRDMGYLGEMIIGEAL